MTQARPIEAERISLALAAILSSQTFARTERLRTFLKFVVEHEQLGLAHQLKGYTIGVDVFSRDGVLDPGVDALVRVQAGKLRRLLNLYYADEGRNDPVRIRIPLGGYVPVYEWGNDPRRLREANAARPPGAERSDRDAILLHGDLAEPASDMDPAIGAGRSVPALPLVFSAIAPGSDWRAKTFDTALRITEAKLCAFKLAPQPAPLPEEPPPLTFVLWLDSVAANGPLFARLVHVATGEVVASRSRPAGATTCSRQVAAFANQFVAETMTLSGEVYAFCRRKGLSSTLMDCLEATYQYQLENSHDAYLEASRHQQRLAHPRRLPGFITELSELLALQNHS